MAYLPALSKRIRFSEGFQGAIYRSLDTSPHHGGSYLQTPSCNLQLNPTPRVLPQLTASSTEREAAPEEVQFILGKLDKSLFRGAFLSLCRGT